MGSWWNKRSNSINERINLKSSLENTKNHLIDLKRKAKMGMDMSPVLI